MLMDLITVIPMQLVRTQKWVLTAFAKLVSLEAGNLVLISTNVLPMLILAYKTQLAQIQSEVLSVLAMPGSTNDVGKHRF